jgi:hypothetical protein
MPRRLVSGSLVLATMLGGLVAGADLMSQLGFRPDEAKEALLTAVARGDVHYFPARAAMKSASPELRAALVKGVLDWGRTALETPEFAAQYLRVRESHKPTPPTAADDEMKQAQAAMRAQIDAAKKELATMPPDMRKIMEETMRQMEAQQKAQANDPALQASMKALRAEEDTGRQQRYEREMVEWERNYPADVHQLVAKRLRVFLDVSADVDFNAKLVARNKRMEFADPRYEAKPREWKLCYRAGKPAVDSARAFASSWLSAARPTAGN